MSMPTRLAPLAAISNLAVAAEPAREFVPAERSVIFPESAAPGLVRAVCYVVPSGITGYWTPTWSQLEGAEAHLQEYLSEKHREPRSDWARYHRQIAGVRSGDRHDLFISYFPMPRTEDEWVVPKEDPRRAPDGWRRVPFWINNGGNEYFRVIYSPQNGAYSWYEQNNTSPSFTPDPTPAR